MGTRGIVLVAITVAATALAVGGALSATGCGGAGKPSVVPDLRGQRLDIAESTLEQTGLDFEISGGGTFGVVVRSRWWVCDQDPRPGQRSSEVLLVVDRSCEWTVPNVTDLTVERAEETLQHVGVPYDVADIEGRRPLAGWHWIVCDQDPPAGLGSSRVRLTVARACEVPDATGMTLARAAQVLEDTGVPVTAFTRTGARPLVESRWAVCEQDPLPGEPANRVVLTVARACPVPIPDLEGYELDDAAGELEGAGLAYEIVTEGGRKPAEPSFWEVCDQDPEAGATGTFVRLFAARDCSAS